ncbi:MAG: 50S ribosomal protein L32 [Candidatus Sumerlaeia bacterium]|nr:50S ribosomal protein L32 [Candidatus Sumerlaeia bacterium]
MPVPRRRHSTTRRRKARTHDKLTAPTVSECPKCHQPIRPHRVCPHCGTYRDREYKAVVTK